MLDAADQRPSATAGDFLERYSGNLDIITAAAARVGEQLAQQLGSEVTA